MVIVKLGLSRRYSSLATGTRKLVETLPLPSLPPAARSFDRSRVTVTVSPGAKSRDGENLRRPSRGRYDTAPAISPDFDPSARTASSPTPSGASGAVRRNVTVTRRAHQHLHDRAPRRRSRPTSTRAREPRPRPRRPARAAL